MTIYIPDALVFLVMIGGLVFAALETILAFGVAALMPDYQGGMKSRSSWIGAGITWLVVCIGYWLAYTS